LSEQYVRVPQGQYALRQPACREGGHGQEVEHDVAPVEHLLRKDNPPKNTRRYEGKPTQRSGVLHAV
jgi:hypothetical protein